LSITGKLLHKEDIDMSSKIILNIVALGIIVTASLQASSFKPASGFTGGTGQDLERSEFRYLIVETSIDRGDPKVPVRIVTILLDEKSFSEDTLRKLYHLVSKRFPKPKSMKVWVYTSLDDVATPEEEGAPAMAPWPKEDLNREKHHKAFMLRQDGNALFRYRNLEGTEITTVVIKGKNPMAKIGKK
jgi:hypothetical protein